MVAVLYLADMWPNSHDMIHLECQKAILELFYVMTKYYKEEPGYFCMPMELVVLIVKCIVMVWPEPHGCSITEVEEISVDV